MTDRTYVGGELAREGLEFVERGADLHLPWRVEQDGEQRLRRARVGDHLCIALRCIAVGFIGR